MNTIVGKSVLVAGGGTGLGRATAIELSRRGAAVGVADARYEQSLAVTQEITSAGGIATALHLNYSQHEEFEWACKTLVHDFGGLDIVVNNINAFVVGPPTFLARAEWESVLAAALPTLTRSIAMLLPGLLGQRSGHVVNLFPVLARDTNELGLLPCSIAESTVLALSEALSLYLEPRNIGMSCLCRGPADLLVGDDRTTVAEFKSDSLDTSTVASRVVDAIVERRFSILPNETLVREMATCVASDANSEFFGSTIVRIVADAGVAC